MNFNLSSNITLERIPERYYRPTDAFERLRQTRYEKLQTEVFTNEKEGSRVIAHEIAELIISKNNQGEKCILGLSGGSSPLDIYAELVQMHKKEGLSFENVIVFNVTEFFPLSNPHQHSNSRLLREHLLNKVNFNPENFYTPDFNIDRTNIYDFCRNYEQQIENFGGFDLVLVSVGLVGNIAYNEPGSQVSSITRLMLLDNVSRRDLKQFYNS
ncbi:MAG TPA: 6-phosphogluconolactonase, partial [Paludibacter sp.]|nr:6-phosphogluconolactonase [Paludibacter sp.]